MNRLKLSKRTTLIILAVTMGTVSVLMNVFAGLRPFYKEGSAGVWRAVSFSTVAVSWLPFLVGDILADKYDRKIALGVPALAFAIQVFVYTLAILGGYKDEGWQNLFAGMLGNYTGLLVNYVVFITIKKVFGTKEWYTLAGAAIISSIFGQLGDNMMYMMFSPFQWAGNVLQGESLIGIATQWKSVNLAGANGEWTGKVAVLGWDSLFLKSAFEVGVEVLIYPLTLLFIRQIDKMPEYYDLRGLPVYRN